MSESRIHYGPGYRIYFFKRQGKLIIVACVGDKSTQSKDIERAKRIKKKFLDEQWIELTRAKYGSTQLINNWF